MLTQPMTASSNHAEAQARFLQALGEWIDACIDRYAAAPATDVHDQGTYTTGWAPYLRSTQDARALRFLKARRDAIHAHFERAGLWHHGYWRMQEAHHGTEHVELFLGTLLHLDPEDGETKHQLRDAAEHVIHAIPDIPPWFDPTTGLFRSMYMGTEGVRREPGMELNIPDHLRFVNLCRLADQAGGDARYMELATRYTGRWADAILAGDNLPVGLTPDGPIYDLTGDAEATYRAFAGMAGHLDDDVDRAENLLASNGTGALLALWQHTGDARFRCALERVLDVLARQLHDPDAGAAADALRAYRRATGARRYDAAIEAAVAPLDPFAIQELGIEPDVRRPARPHGIGKRSDAPNWFEDGAPRRHSPILLAVAAEIRDDVALATRALDLARTAFQLARRTLPDGRHHGCAANTVSAVARGHGRENHAGMTTAVLAPLLDI
jgi:hypothetical protein